MILLYFLPVRRRLLPLLENKLICVVEVEISHRFVSVFNLHSENGGSKRNDVWRVFMEQKSETRGKLQQVCTEFSLLFKNLSGLLKSY